jgi:superfamily II DNA/RNA helicase
VQKAFVVYEPQKMPLIKFLLQEKDYTRVIVFCSKKQAVKQLAAALKKARFSVEEIHSDLDQTTREQVLQDYRNRRTKILVATDVLSRGIDIEDIELVINYDVPHDGEDYVHRIGRTARAAGTGSAYTLVSEMEQRNFARIEELIDKTVEKAPIPEDLGPAPEYAPQQRRSKPGFGGGGQRNGGGARQGGGHRQGGNGQHRSGGNGGRGPRNHGAPPHPNKKPDSN